MSNNGSQAIEIPINPQQYLREHFNLNLSEDQAVLVYDRLQPLINSYYERGNKLAYYIGENIDLSNRFDLLVHNLRDRLTVLCDSTTKGSLTYFALKYSFEVINTEISKLEIL
jgi:hypothetical protein